MQYKTAGQILREKRQEEGWTLEEAERLTRIKRKYIKALEDDNYSAIPGDFYIRAYIKQYADRLGIDYSPLINYYETGEELGFPLNDTGDIDDEFIPEEDGLYLPVDDEEDPEKKQNSFLKHLPVILLSSAALLILGGVLAVVLLYKPDAPLSSAVPSSSQVSTSSTVESSSLKNSNTSKESKPKESKVESASTNIEVSGSGTAVQANITNAPNPVKVAVSVDSGVRSWISISNTNLVGGTTLGDQQGEVTVDIPAEISQAVITLGVVPGVNITVDGEKVDLSNLTSSTSGTVTLQLSYKKEESE